MITLHMVTDAGIVPHTGKDVQFPDPARFIAVFPDEHMTVVEIAHRHVGMNELPHQTAMRFAWAVWNWRVGCEAANKPPDRALTLAEGAHLELYRRRQDRRDRLGAGG